MWPSILLFVYFISELQDYYRGIGIGTYIKEIQVCHLIAIDTEQTACHTNIVN